MVILEQIQKSEQFTETENSIIQYLLTNSYQVRKVTIQELAKATYSSNATVIRLCQKLGYEGFRDFRVAFAQELESSKYVVNTIDYSQPFRVKETTDEIVKSIYSLYKETIDEVQTKLNVHELENIADCMSNAEHIFIFGMGDVKLTVRSFINKAIKIGYFPILATENNEEGYICTHITSKDCALFVTYNGNHKSYNKCMNILRANHAKILTITANLDSEVVRYSSHHIVVPNKEREEKIATFYSQLVFEYILNLIYALMYRTYMKKMQK